MSSKFQDALKRSMAEVANAGLQERGAELQRILDRVASNARGRPVNEVTATLRSVCEPWGLLDADTVTAYARALSAGQRVIVRIEPVQL